jgi:hypothetical protein
VANENIRIYSESIWCALLVLSGVRFWACGSHACHNGILPLGNLLHPFCGKVGHVMNAALSGLTTEDIELIIDHLKPWCCGAFTGWVGKTGRSRITLDHAEDHFSLCMLDMQDDLRSFLLSKITEQRASSAA